MGETLNESAAAPVEVTPGAAGVDEGLSTAPAAAESVSLVIDDEVLAAFEASPQFEQMLHERAEQMAVDAVAARLDELGLSEQDVVNLIGESDPQLAAELQGTLEGLWRDDARQVVRERLEDSAAAREEARAVAGPVVARYGDLDVDAVMALADRLYAPAALLEGESHELAVQALNDAAARLAEQRDGRKTGEELIRRECALVGVPEGELNVELVDAVYWRADATLASHVREAGGDVQEGAQRAIRAAVRGMTIDGVRYSRPASGEHVNRHYSRLIREAQSGAPRDVSHHADPAAKTWEPQRDALGRFVTQRLQSLSDLSADTSQNIERRRAVAAALRS